MDSGELNDMYSASFCFHAELNHFLPRHQKQVKITHFFKDRSSIKDMIEALGVPHPEVDCIEVNGKCVDFSYLVDDGDAINVYPISMTQETHTNLSVKPKPLKVMRFVLDIHLGKLATSLRLLGFDTLYRNDYEDAELAQISSSQDRILLTRDRGLLMRSIVNHGYYVRETNPKKQIVEVVRRFNLNSLVSPFKRCLRCNGLLASVAKNAVIEQLPANVKSQVDDFHRCQDCKQVYWKGSHYNQLRQFIDRVLDVSC